MGKTSFTPVEDQFIRDNYLIVPVKKIAAQMGRSFCGVNGRLKALKLFIPDALKLERKSVSQFTKGISSFNKGLKQTDFMSKEAIERSRITCFKKGHHPHNTRSDGAISIRKDKSGYAYKYIRVGLGKWELLQRINFEKEFGSIKDDHIIVFKDGNSLNCEPSNLTQISKVENMANNTIHQYPPEIKEVIRVLSKVKKQIEKNGQK